MLTRRVHKDLNHDVYIGRPSKWGNPYTHKKETIAPHFVPTRKEAVERYREYILSNKELLDDLEELRGRRLGCWCKKGQRCHGDVLVDLLENGLPKEKEEVTQLEIFDMERKKRPFNQDAYNKMDKPSKLALVDMMSSKGYELVGDIDKEEYKKYDLKFKKGDEEISFENEMRKPFDKIKRYYNTIHIPIRKAKNQSDWYVVWNIGCTECAMIETSDIRKYAKTDIVEIDCNEGTGHNYIEDFIDVPKKDWTFYKLNDNGRWKVQ